MKKCTLILMVVLTIASCKKEKEDSTTVGTETNVENLAPSSNCITLEGYYTSPDTETKAEWLRQHGDSVCECTLEESVLENHRVKGIVSDQKEKYVINWANLKKIIGSHGYDAYLSVIADKSNKEKIDTLIMAEKYGDKGYYFSTALIRSLAKKYAKDDNSEFQFSFAKLNQKSVQSLQSVVVIQAVGNPSIGNSVEANPYYDYSTDPHSIPVRNIPL